MQAVKMVGVLEAEPLPPRPSLGSAHGQVNSAHGHTARKTRLKHGQNVQTRTGCSKTRCLVMSQGFVDLLIVLAP